MLSTYLYYLDNLPHMAMAEVSSIPGILHTSDNVQDITFFASAFIAYLILSVMYLTVLAIW